MKGALLSLCEIGQILLEGLHGLQFKQHVRLFLVACNAHQATGVPSQLTSVLFAKGASVAAVAIW